MSIGHALPDGRYDGLGVRLLFIVRNGECATPPENGICAGGRGRRTVAGDWHVYPDAQMSPRPQSDGRRPLDALTSRHGWLKPRAKRKPVLALACVSRSRMRNSWSLVCCHVIWVSMLTTMQQMQKRSSLRPGSAHNAPLLRRRLTSATCYLVFRIGATCGMSI